MSIRECVCCFIFLIVVFHLINFSSAFSHGYSFMTFSRFYVLFLFQSVLGGLLGKIICFKLIGVAENVLCRTCFWWKIFYFGKSFSISSVWLV